MNIEHIVYDPLSPLKLIDAINYNFDQFFSNAYGSSGIDGATGLIGTSGLQGSIGATGLQGSIGATGLDGSSTDIRWNIDNTSYINTNIVFQTNTESEKTKLILGNNTPTQSDAFRQLTIDRDVDSYESNIRFTTPGSNDFADLISTGSHLDIKFNAGAESSLISFDADNIRLIDSTDNPYFAITSELSNWQPISFNTDVSFNNDVYIQPNNDIVSVDHILRSNELGEVSWVDPHSIVSSVPIGTIVPIMSSMYNSSNFNIISNFTAASTPGVKLVKAGSGKVGTEFEGWYLCHSYKWKTATDSDVGFQDSLPEIPKTSTTYTPAAGVITDTFEKIVLSKSINTTSNNGTITSSIDDRIASDINIGDDIELNGSNPIDHTKLTIVKLPYIIYLGASDLTFNTTSFNTLT